MINIVFEQNIKNLEAGKELKAIAKKMSEPQVALKEIGVYLLDSTSKNFWEEGRPIKWKRSKRAIRENGITLIDTEKLKNSITASVSGNVLKIGTNVKYAAIHQFGGPINHPPGTRVLNYKINRESSRFSKQKRANFQQNVNIPGYTVLMPARPFLVIQDEDKEKIKEIFNNYIFKIDEVKYE